MKKLELRIIAPGMKLEKSPPTIADMVIVHCITGELGILPGRVACSMVLGKGSLRAYDGENEYRMRIDGGVASVANDVVTVLSNSVEWGAE